MTTQSLGTTISSTRSSTLGDTLNRTTARYPSKTALIDGTTSLTYKELNNRVNQLANSLSSEGVHHGDRVVLLSKNCWEFVAISYATAKIGAILTPINFMLGDAEIAFILDDCTPKAVITQTEFLGTMQSALGSSSVKPALLIEIASDRVAPTAHWQSLTQIIEAGSSEEPSVVVREEDPLRIMYTSGTESQPKGVLHSSSSLIAEYVSCIIDGGMSHDDIDLHTLPFYHCAQLDCFLGPDIYLGATSVILPGPAPDVVLDTIAQLGITKYFAPPTVWISLLRSPKFETADLSSLAKGYYGASPMPVEILKELLSRLPNMEFWNFYGQTELAPVATILPPHEQIDHPGSAGRPVLNVETVIMSEDGTILPAGEIGEVVHRGPQITSGYWNKPELTAQAFAHGWFHSGDLGVFDDAGRLTIVDRIKDVIKTGGENVASREVEEALYGHESVSEVAVFATPHEKWVETVTAAIVLKKDHVADQDDLQQFARTKLATYKVPTVIRFYDSLPKNPSGKILKRELRETFGA